jgi:peroxiredoxin
MRKAVKICFFLIAVFFAVIPAKAENVLRDFTLTTIDGNTINTEDFKGTPMLITIMADWCKMCREDAPKIQKAYLNFKDKGVLFLGVFMRSTENNIKRFVQSTNITFPVGRDNGITRQFSVFAVPVNVFITSEGKVVKKHFGPIHYADIVSGINKIL